MCDECCTDTCGSLHRVITCTVSSSKFVKVIHKGFNVENLLACESLKIQSLPKLNPFPAFSYCASLYLIEIEIAWV